MLQGARRSSAQRSTLTRPLHGKPRDALGQRAAAGVPDRQSASEPGERAEGPKSPREQGSGLAAKKQQFFFKILVPGAVGRRKTELGRKPSSRSREPASSPQRKRPLPKQKPWYRRGNGRGRSRAVPLFFSYSALLSTVSLASNSASGSKAGSSSGLAFSSSPT